VVDFSDGVNDYIRIYCLVDIEVVIGIGLCMNIKSFYCI
jgi:hypothetical protein